MGLLASLCILLDPSMASLPALTRRSVFVLLPLGVSFRGGTSHQTLDKVGIQLVS
jgi:hypothetical protein